MCGIAGAFNVPKAAEETVMALHGIQHRATDFAGIVTSDGTNPYPYAGVGVVRKAFEVEDPDKILNKLHGRHSIGHIRYSTAKRKKDDKYRNNTQPILGNYGTSWFALAHNGNLPNTRRLKNLANNRTMATNMDTEYIVRLLEQRQTGDFIKDLAKVLPTIKGSYALGILLPQMLVAVQGPHNNRPLCLGKRGTSYFICSESCGLDNVDAEFVRELDPGEILCITKEGLSSTFLPATDQKRCFFELNYFSHPASVVFGRGVEEYQLRLGAMLEKYCPTPGADIVVPVPDSAEMIAIGYATSGASGRYHKAIRRNHYVGRSFIEASQAKRDTTVANKFTFTPRAIAGKSIVIVDDSIVRGTTLRRIVKKLRHYGAKEVHLRIGTPPIGHPCRYGIDISTYKELVASRLNPQQIAEELGADSLMFFPLEAQKELLGDPQNFCYACITGEYW